MKNRNKPCGLNSFHFAPQRSFTVEVQHPDFAPGSPAFQASILRDLGKLVITYDKHKSTTDFNGTRTVLSYKVVWQSTDSAFVVTGEADEESGKQIHFQSPEVCWVHTGRFVEYFSKLKNA
jgi:hypothetical protein